jgi:SPOR domain
VTSVETPPPAEDAVPQQQCPRCGAPMTDRQEWCLNCGAAVGTRVAAAPGWRVPIAIGAALLAIAAIAVAIAIVQLADDTDQVAQNPPPATPTPAPPGAAPTPQATVTPEATLTPDPTLPEASGQETPDPTDTPEPSTGGSGADIAEWPAGESGWTVVLASDTSESAARRKARDFKADGIAGVGVLDSDDFSSLRGGFWVVFAGQHDSQAEASDALDGIDARDAYIRRIEPN